MRLFRLNIEVTDLAQAHAFYEALLGLKARPDRGSRFYVTAGEVTLQVVQVPSPQLAAKALYFAVDDLDAVHTRAGDLGCLSRGQAPGGPAGEPRVQPWGERSFYAQDPSGNPLCFVAEGTIYDG